MKPIIEISKISKRYLIYKNQARYRTLRESITSFIRPESKREVWALRNITFSMEPGETMGIIGENGAGKTTLLKILSKITAPTSGKGVMRGRVASLLEVGTGFHHELTGRENIFLNGVILGLTKKEVGKNFDKIVDFADIKDFLDTPLKHYSTGMWARLAFAVAAHLDPEILLIDEVLSVGDAEFQKKSLSKMNDLSKHGRTVLFVSHNKPAVRQLCTRCMYISGGLIKKIGDVNDVIGTYLSNHIVNDNGAVDLTNYTKRKGSQKVKMNRIELRNQNGNITGNFAIGDDLWIHLFFESIKKTARVKIVVDILETNGDQICSIYDSDSGFSMTNVSGKKHVALCINDLRFYPGKYNIDVWLISEMFNFKYDSYDELDSVLSFNITNYFVSNRPLTRREGLFYLTPKWEEYEV